MRAQRNPTSHLERDTAEYDRIELTARQIIAAFGDQDPLQTVMALRLAAQRIYDTRCRDRGAKRAAREAELAGEKAKESPAAAAGV